MHVSQTTRCACLFLILCTHVHAQRSFLRSQTGPYLTTRWQNDTKTWALYATCLSHWGVFGPYNKEYLQKYWLPDTNIPYRTNTAESISGQKIKNIITHFIQELQQVPRRADYQDVITLKDRDFNFKDHSGDIIVRCKNYPFVIKLFIETPATFVQPCKKGIEPASFFFMSNGCNRFLAGFTRIKNLENITHVLQKNPTWSSRIELPRKWYWEPPNTKKLIVTGHNMGPQKIYKQTFPSIYALICDYVPYTHNIHQDPTTKKLVPEILNLFGQYLDPNPKNYVIEKDTGKIVIIDTEHFPTLMGAHDKPLWNEFKSYKECYAAYAGKFLTERYGRNKYQRNMRKNTVDTKLFKEPTLCSPAQ